MKELKEEGQSYLESQETKQLKFSLKEKKFEIKKINLF
jgi:hypothetical protein